MDNKEYLSTENYYNNHAQSFIDNTFNLSSQMSPILEDFVNRLPKNAVVLDVGCGSGRDSLSFLEKGFHVVAIDNSTELARHASDKINHPVLVADILNISQMDWTNKFDGVWAMASLLHLKKEDLPLALDNCIGALKDGGVFFASFKVGNHTGFDDKGRFFSFYQQEELKELLENTGLFDKIEFKLNEDNLQRADVSWISVFAHKSLELKHHNKRKHTL